MPSPLVKFEELAVKLLMPNLDKNEEWRFPSLLHTDRYYLRGHYIMLLGLGTLNVVKGNIPASGLHLWLRFHQIIYYNVTYS